MAHKEQTTYIVDRLASVFEIYDIQIKNKEPLFFEARKIKEPASWKGFEVIEIGSRDVNGSIRGAIPEYASKIAKWKGYDLIGGPGVDVVGRVQVDSMLAHAENPESYDVVVSGEALEHDRFWYDTLIDAAKLLYDGGHAIFTAAGIGRPEHGTTRSNPDDSPGTNDYYGNISLHSLSTVAFELSLLKCYFSNITILSRDIYFTIRKDKALDQLAVLLLSNEEIMNCAWLNYASSDSVFKTVKEIQNKLQILQNNAKHSVLFFSGNKNIKLNDLYIVSLLARAECNLFVPRTDDAALSEFVNNARLAIASFDQEKNGTQALDKKTWHWALRNFTWNHHIVIFDCENQSFETLMHNYAYCKNFIGKGAIVACVNAMDEEQKAFVKVLMGVGESEYIRVNI